jgi:nucleoside-diphosphate-sugar epimerase
MSEPVVVFGASSYVGGRAIRALLDGGHRVLGVARRPEMARMLLPEESAEFSIGTDDEVAGMLGSASCSIVNFAFVKTMDPVRMYRQNRVLASSIERVAKGRCRRLVQISTLGVFGWRFSAPPEAVRVESPPEDPYGETKLHFEHLAERLARKHSCELAIVRLGNVIGPGSPVWMAGIAQRLLEVKPVGYTGESGFSNATHVDNVADYVAVLVDAPNCAPANGGTYHHLAEFSDRRWPELLDVMSEQIGCRWTTMSRPHPSGPARGPVRRLLKAGYRTRAGRYLRAGLGHVSDSRLLGPLDAWRYTPPPELTAKDAVGGDDAGLLEVLSAEHEFRSDTIAGWTPKLDFDATCSGIAEWIAASGFSIRTE